MKITQAESLKNFLWDIFIRSFECKDALYEDCSVLSDEEKSTLVESYLKNLDIWEKIYNKRVSFIKTNVHLAGNGNILGVKEVFFHPKFGWVVSSGEFKAFLGKVSFNKNVRVNIGHRSYFSGPGIVRGEGMLQIGSYCCIAEGCYINVVRESHPIDYPALHSFMPEPRTSEDKIDLPVTYPNLEKKKEGVTIGNDVWLGRNVRIFCGVNIANGCVIAENSLLKKDYEPYGIYAGIPARLIRYRFPKQIIQQLLEIQWWNWPFSKFKRNARFFGTDLTAFKGSLLDIIENDE